MIINHTTYGETMQNKKTIAINMRNEGEKVENIAQTLNVSRQTVTRWTFTDVNIKRNETKQNCVNLRQLGLSHREIAKQLNIPKPTVSKYVKNVKVSKEIKDALQLRWKDRGKISKDQADARRVKFEKIGFNRVPADPTFRDVCLLYWAEGGKSVKNQFIKFGNTDLIMVKFFYKWLIKESVNISKTSFQIQYCGPNPNIAELTEYWATELNIKPSQFIKPTVRQRKTPLPNEYHGLLAINLGKIELYHQLIGGIKFLKQNLNIL